MGKKNKQTREAKMEMVADLTADMPDGAFFAVLADHGIDPLEMRIFLDKKADAEGVPPAEEATRSPSFRRLIERIAWGTSENPREDAYDALAMMEPKVEATDGEVGEDMVTTVADHESRLVTLEMEVALLRTATVGVPSAYDNP